MNCINRSLACLLSLTILMGLVSAGTVTLTGTCPAYVVSGNTLTFNLLNTGNDTASNLIITPVIGNAQPTQPSYYLKAAPPDLNQTINITVSNVKQYGTFGTYFIVAYQQGSEAFTAVFPCLTSFTTSTTSQVFLTSNVSVTADNNATVAVSTFNGGSSLVDVNVSLILPPTFLYIGPRYYTLNLTPYQTRNVTFRLRLPRTLQAAYSGAALASYSHGNLGYASLNNFVVSIRGKSQAFLGYLPFLLLLAVITAIVLLLAFFLIRKRMRGKKPTPAPQSRAEGSATSYS